MQQTEVIEAIDWNHVADQLNTKGYHCLPKMISPSMCQELIDGYSDEGPYRKKVVMERYRFGLGEYKYFDYPLPVMISTLRKTMYEGLAPIANTWMKALKIERKYPLVYNDFLKECHNAEQKLPAVLILKYGKGGHNTFHQDLYGDVYFPIQVVLFLNEPDEEYTGGEFVLTEQVPRAQSKAIVLRPKRGDMLIFTTNYRPVKGSRGYYRAAMKHGVSEVWEGERHTLGIIFHDART